MKSLSVNKGSLLHQVDLPPSKSYANRALILGALADSSPVIKNLPSATDVVILLKCLRSIGLIVMEQDGGIAFKNTFPECEIQDHLLEVGEGGTTARFLAVMLLLGKHQYKLKLGERLKERPWNDFITMATSLGAEAELTGDILTIQGPAVFPPEIKVDCSLTTQFATAFQLLSIKNKIKVTPVNLQSSQSYWVMTESLVKNFSQHDNYEIPMDWSSATYPMAFAALNHEINFPGLQVDRYQADSKFYDILASLEGIDLTESGIKVRPIKKMHSLDLDVSDCLDLVPTLAYFLSHVEGEHKIKGYENLVHKESNRLEEVLMLLEKFGRKAFISGNTLNIIGHTSRLNKTVSLKMPNDHRMVMAAALFLLHHAGGELSPAEAVTKSYPVFFSLFQNQ